MHVNGMKRKDDHLQIVGDFGIDRSELLAVPTPGSKEFDNSGKVTFKDL